MQKNLQKYWKIVSEKLNLKADVPYLIKYSDGSVQEIDVRLRDFGPKNGMLLISNYDLIKDRSKEIAEMEYGYSCLSEPSDERINQTINASPEDLLREVKDILLDWGYSGLDLEKLKWFYNK